MRTISQAAANAISTYTAMAGIDDDGDPANIGAWHLIQGMFDYADAHGSGPARLVEAALRVRGAERLYLIQVEDARANTTTAMPVSLEQFEVEATSLRIASLMLINGAIKHHSVSPRTMRDPFTNEAIAFDPDRYAAVGFVRAGNMADVPVSAANSEASGLIEPIVFPVYDLPFDRDGAMAAAYETFGNTLRAAGKVSGDRDITYATMLAAVMALTERKGVDPEKLIQSAIDDRAELQPAARRM